MSTVGPEGEMNLGLRLDNVVSDAAAYGMLWRCCRWHDLMNKIEWYDVLVDSLTVSGMPSWNCQRAGVEHQGRCSRVLERTPISLLPLTVLLALPLPSPPISRTPFHHVIHLSRSGP